MMLRLAIVEDDEQQAERLIGYVRRYDEENGEHCEVVRFCTGVDFLSDFKSDFDGVFLRAALRLLRRRRYAETVKNLT